MHRFVLGLFLLLLAVPALAPTAEAADDAIIRVGPGNKDLPLGLPKVKRASPDTDAIAEELWSVVHRDLELTGYFNIKDPSGYIERGKDVEPGTFDFADWRVIKIAGLAKLRVTRSGSSVFADVFVYDVNAGSKLIAKRFRGTADQARYLGHRIADTILLALTGEKGFFGTRIAAVGSRSGVKEIYVMDIDGHGVRSVTRNGSINLSPAWSPDGSAIAWTSYKRENPDLYIKQLASGRTRVLSSLPGINTGAAFSPDGKKVALTRSKNGDSDIYVIDAATGRDLKRITTGGGIDVAPSWSPDGTKLVFSSERSGGSQVFVHEIASGSTRRISRFGAFNFDPVWSPDGKRIAYTGRDDGAFDIFVVNVETGNTKRITEAQGDNEDPTWAPNSQYLLFSSTRGGRSNIWLSTADGRHQVAITSSGGWTQPSWSPAR